MPLDWRVGGYQNRGLCHNEQSKSEHHKDRPSPLRDHTFLSEWDIPAAGPAIRQPNDGPVFRATSNVRNFSVAIGAVWKTHGAKSLHGQCYRILPWRRINRR
jgi:hypothetical protein